MRSSLRALLVSRGNLAMRALKVPTQRFSEQQHLARSSAIRNAASLSAIYSSLDPLTTVVSVQSRARKNAADEIASRNN